MVAPNRSFGECASSSWVSSWVNSWATFLARVLIGLLIALLADGRLPANRRSPGWRMDLISFRTPLALLLVSLGAIAAVWWWLATPITLVRAPIDPNARLQCVSYAPFRNGQTPLIPSTQITAEQVEQDLTQLAKV